MLVLAIGCVCGAYEYAGGQQKTLLPSSIGDYVETELHIISSPFGRSIIYFISGLILTTQGFLSDIVIGLGIAGAGGYIFWNLREAEIALSAMRSHLAEKDLETIFKDSDTNGDKVLDTSEVSALCSMLNMKLNRAELEATISILDKSGQGKVTFDAFKLWYMSKI